MEQVTCEMCGSAVNTDNLASIENYLKMANRAYDANIDEDNKEKVSNQIVQELINLAKILIRKRGEDFGNVPETEISNGLIEDIKIIIESIMMFIIKASVIIDITELYEYIAQQINASAVNGSNVSDKCFGPKKSDKSKVTWNRYLTQQNNCIKVLEYALVLSKKNETKFIVLNNLTFLQNQVINSYSYKFWAKGKR